MAGEPRVPDHEFFRWPDFIALRTAFGEKSDEEIWKMVSLILPLQGPRQSWEVSKGFMKHWKSQTHILAMSKIDSFRSVVYSTLFEQQKFGELVEKVEVLRARQCQSEQELENFTNRPSYQVEFNDGRVLTFRFSGEMYTKAERFSPANLYDPINWKDR